MSYGHRQPTPRASLLAGILLFTLAACSSNEAPQRDRVTITVAPLKLADLTDVEYRLTVTNAASQTVWTREVSSQDFGDGKGALTYVGPCDADSNPNTVSVDILNLIDEDGDPVPADKWANPSPVTQPLTCRANADTLAAFDITVLRSAEQGFFDIAIEFDDVFCSAKLDCQENLLHRPGGERGPTAVVAFACAAGSGQPTWLYFADDIKLTCGERTYFVDPTAGPGNLGSDMPAVFQSATYRGREGFPNVDKCFWNAAIGIEPTATPCTLSARATASSRPFIGGELPPNSVWPEIVWDNIPITGTDSLSCGSHPLNGPDSLVHTTYTRTGQSQYRHELECATGNIATLGTRVCVGEGTPCDLGDPCANGTCTAAGTCELTSTQPDGQLCSEPGACDPLGTCVTACAQGSCEGARPPATFATFAVEEDALIEDAVEDTRRNAYMAKGTEGVGAVDLTDPTSPLALATWSEPDANCHELAVLADTDTETLIAAACGDAGVKLLDFTDPNAPVLRATIPTATPATTLTAIAPFLYTGDGDDILIHDTTDPDAPLALTAATLSADPAHPDDQILKVRAAGPDATRVYCLTTAGRLIASDASDPSRLVELTSIRARTNPTDLDVAPAASGDLVFATFDGPGFYIHDFTTPTPTELYHDGGSRAVHIAVSGYRGAIVYADTRYVTLSLRHYDRPKVLTSSFSPTLPTGLAILSGYAFCPYGNEYALLDYLPFVIGSSPVDGSSGLCGDVPLELRFSEPVDPDCVADTSLTLSSNTTPYPGTVDQRTSEALTFTPSPTLEAATYQARANTVCDTKNNPGPLVPDTVDFEVTSLCVATSDFPNTGLSGQPLRFTWNFDGADAPTSTTLYVSTEPQGTSPYATRWVIPGSANVSGGFEATWVPPFAPTSTTYWVVASVETATGTRTGEVLPVVIAPDPSACPDCAPPAATVLDEATRQSGTFRSAIQDPLDADLAYVTLGADGLEVRDQSDPNNTVVLATWSESNPNLDCQELVQVGDLLYLACGAAGVKCISVADPNDPVLIDTLVTGPTTTIATYGNALYVGVIDRVAIYDLTDPLAPTFVSWLGGASGQGPANIVSVVVDGDLVYCLYADGTLIVAHALTPTNPLYVRTIAPIRPNLTATDFAVSDGLGYCAYRGAGLFIVDLRNVLTAGAFTPTTLWHDGGSDIVAVSVLGRTFACLYGDGSTLTASATIPTAPKTLSRYAGDGFATGLSLLPRWLYCGHGSTLRVIDVPPFVLSSSHRPDTRGVCPSTPVDLFFSAPIAPATVTADAIAFDTAGTLTTTNSRVRFTPSTAFTTGTHNARVTQSDISNTRGTYGPSSDFISTFEISPTCIDWLEVPDTVLSGTPANLRWSAPGATSTFVHVAAWPDPADPYAATTTTAGTTSSGAWAATFTAPTVTTPTTFYAVAEDRTAGAPSTWGPVTSFTVTPALASGQTLADATILDLADEGDLAYAAIGTGLEVQDVSDPNNPVVISRWLDPRGGTCSAVTVKSPYVYLACGTSGVYVLNVSGSTPSIAYWIEQPNTTTLSLYGSSLYLGFGEDIAVWDVTNPSGPLFVRTIDTTSTSALVRVVAIDGLLYGYFQNGTLWVGDLANPRIPTFIRLVASLHPGKIGVELRVIGGVIYLGYRDIGLVAVDLGDIRSPSWTPSILWTLPAPDTNAQILRFDIKGGLVTVVYSNGRHWVGALSANPSQPPTELWSTLRFGTPSAVIILSSGYVLTAWGRSFSYVDPPLWLVASSPAANTSNCGNTTLTLAFSAPVLASSITERALRVEHDNTLVDGDWQVANNLLTFTPDAPLTAGPHTVKVLAPLQNVRGTTATPTTFTFTAGGGCITLTSTPSRVVAGSGALFAWQTTGGAPTNEKLLIASSPFANPQAYTSTSPATFTTPTVATPTTLYARVEATIDGQIARSALTSFTVEPPLSSAPTTPGETLSAIAEGDDGVAYLATGTGLSIRDVSDPDRPIELGRWTTANLTGCDAVAVRGTTVYLACGASGVYVIDVSDLYNPTSTLTLTYDVVSLVVIGDALYLGLADGTIHVFDIALGLAPSLRTTLTNTGSTLLRLVSDGFTLYCLCADGTIGRYDVTDLYAPSPLTSILSYVGGTPVDLTIVDGIAYIGYADGTITIVDVRGPTWLGTITPPPGSGGLIGISYRNGVLACVYANGGFVTVNVHDPANPIRLTYTIGGAAPTLVYIFRSGYAFWSTATTIQLVDLPPVLTHHFPSGGAGCPTSTLTLLFSQPLDPTSLTSSTVIATRDGLPVSFTRTLDSQNGRILRLTPTAPLAGTVNVTVTGLKNLRGTSLATAETRAFTFADVCLTWVTAPASTASGLASTFLFSASNPITTPEILVGPLDRPSSTWTAYPATTGATHSVEFTAPVLASPTRYGAIPRVTANGNSVLGDLVTFVISPEPCSLTPRCDDGNACTDEQCVPYLGCVATADDTNTCDDENACTHGDFCQGGLCRPTSTTTCNAAACEVASCDRQSGQCITSTASDGALCDDGDPDTSVSLCQAGTCEPLPTTTSLNTVSVTTTPTQVIRRIVQVGLYGYAVLEPGGLVILNLANPSNPVPIGSWSIAGRDNCTDLTVVEGRAYLLCSGELFTLDVSSPTAPVFIDATPAPGATSLTYENGYITLGSPSGLTVYQLGPTWRPTWHGYYALPDGPLTRVWYANGYLYTASTSGIVRVFDTSSGTLTPRYVYDTSLWTGANWDVTDFVVIGDYLYLSYAGGGVYALDTTAAHAPSLAWWSGPGHVTSLGYANGILVYGYANGGFVTSNVSDPSHPISLAWTFAPTAITTATVIVSQTGEVVPFSATGPTLSTHDVPPYVTAMSPRPNSSGLCAAGQVRLYFSTSLDPSSVTATSVIVETATGTPIPGTRAVDNYRVTFTPSTPFAADTYRVRVTNNLRNARGTAFSSDGYEATFSVATACLTWTAAPGGIIKGTTGNFAWNVIGATADSGELLISTHPDPLAPIANPTVIAATPSGSGFSAAFTAPLLTRNTVHYATPRIDVGGVEVLGQTIAFTVVAEGCFCSAGERCENGLCVAAPVCDPGYGNCDNYNTNGCERRIDVDDVNHCGGCHVRCGGGVCENGQCLPTILVGSAGSEVFGIDVDETHLYWAARSGNQLRRAKKDGTEQEILATGFFINDLVVDDTHVYFTTHTSQTVYRVPKDGGPPTLIAHTQPNPVGLTLRGHDLFTTSWSNGQLRKISLLDGSVSTLATLPHSNLGGLAVDGDTFFAVGNRGSIYEYDTTTTTTLASPGSGLILADADTRYVYYGGTGRLGRVHRETGAIETFSTTGNTYGIAVDDRFIYWTNASTATINRMAKPLEPDLDTNLLCRTDHADCNDDPDDDCETNTDNDASHCGGCNIACANNEVCNAGTCGPVQCPPGFSDCDNDPSNGCEANLDNDTNHCGACNSPCLSGFCRDQLCVPDVVSHSCLGHQNLGNTTSGHYLVDPDDTGPAPMTAVYCDQETDGGGWTVVARAADTNGFPGDYEFRAAAGSRSLLDLDTTFGTSDAAQFGIALDDLWSSSATPLALQLYCYDTRSPSTTSFWARTESLDYGPLATALTPDNPSAAFTNLKVINKEGVKTDFGRLDIMARGTSGYSACSNGAAGQFGLKLACQHGQQAMSPRGVWMLTDYNQPQYTEVTSCGTVGGNALPYYAGEVRFREHACTDGFDNGDETDVDCGGTTCMRCDPGDACLVASDCASKVCTGNVCQAPTCSDFVQNGDETGTDCGGACGNLCNGVTWQNPVGVLEVYTAQGAGLERTAAGSSWAAGASSVQTITGDGFVSFVATETTRYRMIGLSNGDSNASYTDIDFAWYLHPGAALYIYENSTSIGGFGTYATGDTLRVEYFEGQVRYVHNGVVRYTSTKTPTLPLRVDTSLYDLGATLGGVLLTSCSIIPDDPICVFGRTWKSVANISGDGDTLIRANTTQGWTSGASSQSSFTCGYGAMTVTATETSTERIAGLSDFDGGVAQADTDYGIYFRSTAAINIIESGTNRGAFGTYQAGDVFRVEMNLPTVTYKKNGVVFYTSTVPASELGTWVLDTSFFTPGATLSGLALIDLNPTGDPTCGGADFWKNYNLVVRGTGIKTVVSSGNWDQGASTIATITSGDGFADMTVGETTTSLMAGLGDLDNTRSYTDIDFATYLTGSRLYIYESGSYRGSFTGYLTGDRLRVEIRDGQVLYRRNGVHYYTSAVAPTYPLAFDTSLLSLNSTVNDVVIHECGVDDPLCDLPLDWRNGYNLSADGFSLKRDVGNNSWNSGASTNESISCGQGRVSAVVYNLTDAAFGLGTGDVSQHHNDIEYAFMLTAAGQLRVYESGAQVAVVGPYAIGDELTVDVDVDAAGGPVVRYLQNDVVVYTSLVAPLIIDNYRLDTSFYALNSRFDGLMVTDDDQGLDPTCGGSSFWADVVGAVVRDTSIRREVGGSNYDAGGISQASFTGDGYVEFTLPTNGHTLSAGLSNTNTSTNYTDVEFGIYLSGPTIYIYENSSNPGSYGTFLPGSRFRIERIGGVIRYMRDGAIFYISAVPPTGALFFDTSLYSNLATVTDVVIRACTPEDESCARDINWFDARNLRATNDGRTLQIDSGLSNAWNSGAATLESITCGRGSVSATATETNKDRLFGLAIGNTNTQPSDIEYAIYLTSSGALQVQESGTTRGTFGTYTTGDVLSVEVDAPLVTYKKNGTTFYTSTVPASAGDDYRLDTAFYGASGSLSNLTLTDLDGSDSTCGASSFWTQVVGAVAKANHLRKDTGGSAYNAGAVSVATLDDDGFVEFTVPDLANTFAVGLSNGNTNTNHTDIDHSFYLAGSAIYVYEGSTSRGSFSDFPAYSRFRVEVVDGVVRYLRNGVGVYKSTLTPTFPLLVDTSLYNVGTRIRDVVLAPCDGTCTPTLRWQNGRRLSSPTSGTLVRDSGTNSWTAAASTEQSLKCARGLARTVVTENNTERMFGLTSADTSESYTDITYAFYLVPNGALSIYESGTLRGNVSTYAPGDILEVEADRTVVRYKKNGATVYTSTVAADPIEVYRLDTALYTGGSRLVGLELVDLDPNDDGTCGGTSHWNNLTNVSVKGTSLRKTNTTGWTAGATTATAFTGDGYVTFSAGETSSQVVAGLGTATTVSDFNQIPFGIGLMGGTVYVYESGTSRGTFGTYQTGDSFRVERIGSTIRYLRNGVGLYTSTLTSNPADTLRGQASLYTVSATLRALVATACTGSDESCDPPLRWASGRGVSGTSTSLTRDATGASWSSGAISEEAIDCQQGTVETTITSLTGNRAFGLGRGDDSRSYTDIEYGYWIQNATLTIYESGTSRGNFGTLVVGDILEVDISGTAVRYYRTPPGGSRTLIYTSTTAASPLDTYRLDTSFSEVNSQLSELALDDMGETDPTCGGSAFWKSQNTTVKWNHIIKDGGVGNTWDRGASTQAQIASGEGWLEFTPGETTTTRIIGLGKNDDNDTQADIDFAIQLNNNGQAAVYESGTLKSSIGSYTANDRFRIRVLNGQITYLKNGLSLYTSLLAPVYPLEGDVSLYTTGARIMDVQLVAINPALCGNGVLDLGEGCDDADSTAGDGCAANCQVEPNYACTGAPSVCSPYGVLRSCRAHLVAGATTNGVYTIDPDGGGPNPSFQVWCDQTTDGGGWTVFQRRISASDFYRFYADYAAGFGDPATNYWMGNNRLADFTTRFPTELRVDLTYNSTAYHAKYSSFAISGAADGYRLAVSGYSGTAGDSLTPQTNYRFTTRDVDQDSSGSNCAVDYIGAWWYSSCHSSNLNGLWGSTAYGQGMNWYATTGYYASATFTEMKVREPAGDLGCDGVSGSGRVLDACGVCGDGTSCGATAVPTSGLTTWLRAQDLSAQASGTLVASWPAAPGTTVTAAQATTTRQPTFIASGPNGKPTVRFDGGDRLDLSTNPVATHPRTMFAVISTTTANAHLVGTGSSSTTFLTTYGSGLILSSGRPAAKANNNSSGILMTGANTINDGSPKVISATLATGASELLVGSTVVATSTATANPWAYTRATLGASDGSASNTVVDPFTGDLSEVLIYDRALTATEQQAVRNYLTAKYIPATKLVEMQFEGNWTNTGSLTTTPVGSVALQSGGGAKSDGFANGFVLGTSYLDNQDIFVGGTGEHTFSAWYRGTQTNAAGATYQPGVVIFGDPAGTVWIGLGIDGGLLSVASQGQNRGSRLVNDGQWHHLAWVRRGATWTAYVDGVLDLGPTTFVNSLANHYIRTIGSGYPYANVVGPTALDRVAIFDRALTEAEIRTLARTAIFESTGAAQSFVVPSGVSSVDVKLWGAGGGGTVQNSGGLGGGGAFVRSTLPVIPGELLTLVVGGGGGLKTQDTMHGGGGGGLSGLFRATYSQAGALVIAGGGGGAVHCASGGGGGGPNGSAGQGCYGQPGFGGGGGTLSAGGAAGAHVSNTAPTAGSALLGGNGGDPEHSGTSPAAFGGGASGGIGGGGGGGFFGGGGGGHHNGVTGGAGGGGASYSVDGSATMSAGAAPTPGGTSDPDHNGTAGRGGNGPEAGRPGRVIIRW